MGGAKFMGRDYGTIYSKPQRAIEHLFFWMVGGVMISLILSVMFLPTPNFYIPLGFYLMVGILLLIRYFKLESKETKSNKKELKGGLRK